MRGGQELLVRRRILRRVGDSVLCLECLLRKSARVQRSQRALELRLGVSFPALCSTSVSCFLRLSGLMVCNKAGVGYRS